MSSHFWGRMGHFFPKPKNSPAGRETGCTHMAIYLRGCRGSKRGQATFHTKVMCNAFRIALGVAQLSWGLRPSEPHRGRTITLNENFQPPHLGKFEHIYSDLLFKRRFWGKFSSKRLKMALKLNKNPSFGIFLN